MLSMWLWTSWEAAGGGRCHVVRTSGHNSKLGDYECCLYYRSCIAGSGGGTTRVKMPSVWFWAGWGAAREWGCHLGRISEHDTKHNDHGTNLDDHNSNLADNEYK